MSRTMYDLLNILTVLCLINLDSKLKRMKIINAIITILKMQ